MEQGHSWTCTLHALANTIADQLKSKSKIDIDPTRIVNILVNENKHIGAVWPDKFDYCSKPIITMDKETKNWISIKIKTVKRVNFFISSESHILSHYSDLGNHCVFVKEKQGDCYHCLNSYGKNYNPYPVVDANQPYNILWTVQVECEVAPNS